MKVIIAGYGRMGQLIEQTLLAETPEETCGANPADDAGRDGSVCSEGTAASLQPPHEIVARIDLAADKSRGIYDASMLETLDIEADLIMDFSNPSLTDSLIAYAKRTNTPLLSGTTNLTSDQMAALRALGETIPVVWASNYSFGINLFRHVLEEIAPVLDGWDVEVTETHHNKKVDAPSGTAKTLIQAIDPEGKCDLVYGREGNCGARTKNEIGVHAIRGGTMVGEHKVDFFGPDEVFEIRHQMGSRQILVNGAVKIGKQLLKQKPGYYSIDQLLFG